MNEQWKRNELVLKGLEEQRKKALRGPKRKEVKKKEIDGYIYDKEKDRYFPKSVLRDRVFMSVVGELSEKKEEKPPNYPFLSLLLHEKYGNMKREWSEWCGCLCMKRGNCVEVCVSPRVVREVVLYKESVVVGCSRSVLLYSLRERNGEMELSAVCNERRLRGELIHMRVCEDCLYVLLNEGRRNVLLRWDGSEWLKVTEVSSELRVFEVIRWLGDLVYVFCGSEVLVKKGDECVYRSVLRSVCLCMEERWLGCGNGELLRLSEEGLKRVLKLKSGIKRVSVYENEVLVCGMDGVLGLLYGVCENWVLAWLNGKLKSVDGCLDEDGVLLIREDGVWCLDKKGVNGEVMLRKNGMKCMYKREDLLLCVNENGVLLKSVNGKKLSQVSF